MSKIDACQLIEKIMECDTELSQRRQEFADAERKLLVDRNLLMAKLDVVLSMEKKP